MPKIRFRGRRTWHRRSFRAAPPRRLELIDLANDTVRVAVEGDGPPLLLLAGLGADLDMWAPVSPHLRGFGLVAFDPPGMGGSGPIRQPIGMAGLADLAARLLEALGLERTDVLGYSWGGALAQELAHRHPEVVRRLVLCATTCGLGGVPGNPRALAALTTPWRHAPGRAPRVAGFANQLCAIAQWSSLPWLHELGQPTLIVAAEDDAVVPLGNARLLAGRIPDSRLHVVPGADHLLLLDQPGDVVPVVRQFLLARDAGSTSACGARGSRGAWSFLARSRTG
jgi:poly(3-hydroxyoctanoate) depolymerase